MARALPEKGFDVRLQLGEIEVVVLSVTQFQSAITRLGVGIDEFLGVEHISAVIALVRTGALVAANVAGALDVTVGQEFRGGRGIPLLAELLEEKPVLQQGQEYALGNREVVLRMCGGEEVVGNPCLKEELKKAVVILLVDLFDWHALLVGGKDDRGAVRVGAADHQDIIPLQAMIARNDIAGQVRAGDVADVDLSVGIGPGNGDEDVGGHGNPVFSVQFSVWNV